ncbi:MAG: hypothetical protein LBN38_06760, partial [Verrucomicrobiota bacterium]|nr:hypothetical protein [Verrucomicrobiota bacterium]
VPQFENHIREENTIQKLASMIGRQAQVTPLEVRRTFETLMDTFTVEYAAILRDSVAEGVSVTEEDAKALFDAEPALFTLPEQRDVTYVAIPLADYLDSSREFDEDALLDYYELHMQEYTTQETAEDGSTRDVVADFTEVQVDIADALRRREAMEAAEADASDLSFQALPNNEGVVPDFNAVAEAAGRPVVTLEGMSRFEVPVEDAGAAFTMEAFALRLDAYDRVSGPIIGTDHVYVIYLDRIHEPRVPMFEDIQDRALAAAEQRAVAEAMNVKAAEVKTAAEEGIAAGKSFEEAVRATGVEVSTAEPFTGLSASSATNETVQALVQAVVAYNTGEVTEPVLTMDGLLVAYVQNRAPADSALFESYSPEIASSIRNRRAEERFVAWQADLVSTNHFTDLQRSTADYQDENGFAEDESDTL